MVVLPDLFLASRLLWIFSIAAHIVLAVKLWKTGLGYRYRVFFSYMLLAGAQLSVLFCSRWLSSTYFWTWVVTETVVLVFYVLVLLETDSLILQDYPALLIAGQKFIYRTLVVALIVSAVTLFPDSADSTGEQKILVYFRMLERGVVFSMTLFLMVILVFVVRYRMALRSNISLHSILFAMYFWGLTLAYFMLNTTGRSVTDEVNVALLGVTCLALAIWIGRFDPAGEKPVVVGIRPAREEAVHLINQLDALNTALLRQAKKL